MRYLSFSATVLLTLLLAACGSLHGPGPASVPTDIRTEEGTSLDATSVEVGARLLLVATDGTGRTVPVVWTSDDPSVAEVAEDGTLHAKAPGTVTIAARRPGDGDGARISLQVRIVEADDDAAGGDPKDEETPDGDPGSEPDAPPPGDGEDDGDAPDPTDPTDPEVPGSDPTEPEPTDPVPSEPEPDEPEPTEPEGEPEPVPEPEPEPDPEPDDPPEPSVEGVTIDPSRLDLDVDDTLDLTVDVQATNGASTQVTWSSDAPNVASVDEASGVLTAHAEGTATITATSVADPSVSDAIVVRVSEPTPVSAYAEAVLQYTNEARAEARTCGTESYEATDPLSLDDALNTAAQTHSEDQASMGRMTHFGSDGSDLRDRINAEGYAWRAIGENVASGFPSARAVVDAWLDSPGHCTNIMNPTFEDLGVGLAESESGTPYWTQNFAAPR